MPYLRITCPDLPGGRKRIVADRLTSEINNLFFNPRAPVSRAELRERTTVHFTVYRNGDLFIGGRTPDERGCGDITVELSDWGMSKTQQRRVAEKLTTVLAELFAIDLKAIENINIRFHPYPPKDLSVGGQLLSDRVPRIARIFKWLFG